MNPKQAWKNRGFSCDIWEDPQGQIWSNYVHSVDELFMVIEGEIELILGGKTLYPKPGEEISIPAQTVHTVKNTGKTHSKWYYGYKQK